MKKVFHYYCIHTYDRVTLSHTLALTHMQLLVHGNDIRMDRHLSVGTCCMLCGCGWVRVSFCWGISAWAIHAYTTERNTHSQTDKTDKTV